MRLLLDTHIWLWYGLGDTRLPETMRSAIAAHNNELYLSPISLWETLRWAETGKILLPPDPLIWIDFNLKSLGTYEATINRAVTLLSHQLACPSQDIADRFIAATSVHYNLTLMTTDLNLLNTPSLAIFE